MFIPEKSPAHLIRYPYFYYNNRNRRRYL